MKKKSIWDMHRLSADEYRDSKKMPLVVVLDNVRSLNNIGSLFRTCDCFSATGIVLCGISATPPSAEIHKTALGAEDTVEWHYFADTREAVDTLRRQGYNIVCLEQVQGSISLEDFRADKNSRYALVLGNEVDGVQQEIVDMADTVIEIPQSGTKHSLNVTVSAAVTMWEFYRQTFLE